MPRVSVPRAEIEDGSLPPVCVVCGSDASTWQYSWISAPSLGWLLFSPLLGLIGFWANVLARGGQPGETPKGLPFCERHRNYWRRRAWFIVGGFVPVLATFVVAAVLPEPGGPGKKDEPHWVFGIFACWILVFLPAFLIVHLAAMRPTGGNRKALILSGASREFAQALPGSGGDSV
jgi:hypothetical protein